MANSRTQDSTAPGWMKVVLIAAAVYNLAWGAFAILFPNAIFNWAGFDPMPIYPQLWQCIGMIVGVYGIGYWIAAYKPFVHWPIVFVGLLGKVFGPLGFLNAVWTGTLPPKMGWTILTNDLIWWIPFAAILFEAAKFHQSRGTVHAEPAEKVSDPMKVLKSQHGATLADISASQSVFVVFLRHSGCTFCREALGDLSSKREQIQQAGHTLAIVHMGDNADSDLFTKYKLNDVHRFSDPECRLYQQFDLKTGSASQLFGPSVWLRGFKVALLDGHGFGGLTGNGFQMPGVFIVKDSKILSATRLKTAADRPDYEFIACEFEASSSVASSTESVGASA